MKKIILFAALLIGCGSNENENIIKASGTIETTEVNLSSKSPGQVIYLRVDEGTLVHQGDTVAVIDTTNYALNYRQAQAAAAQAQAQFELQEHGSRKEDIAQAADQVSQAEANYKN